MFLTFGNGVTLVTRLEAFTCVREKPELAVLPAAKQMFLRASGSGQNRADLQIQQGKGGLYRQGAECGSAGGKF